MAWPGWTDGAVGFEVGYATRRNRIDRTNLRRLSAASAALLLAFSAPLDDDLEAWAILGATHWTFDAAPISCPPIDCIPEGPTFVDGTVHAVTAGAGMSAAIRPRLALRADMRAHAPWWSSAPETPNDNARIELGLGLSVRF